MSAHYSIKQMPPKWVSAHRKCEFKYAILGTLIGSAYNDGNGYVKINLGSAFFEPLAVGDRVFISGSTYYNGFNVIREVHSTIQYTLETTYILDDNGFIQPVTLPTVSLYKGYTDGELVLPLYPSGSLDMFDIQPRELLAEFQPEIGIEGLITFDISGYLKAALESPYKVGYNDTETNYVYAKSATESYLPMNTAKIEVIIESNLERTLIAHNTSLAVDDLNRYFVDTVRGLQPLKQVPSFTQGVNDYDLITGTNNTIIRYGN